MSTCIYITGPNMPITVTTVQTRPNTSVNFWTFNEATQAHLKAVFRDTGKVIDRTVELSHGDLVQTITRVYTDQTAFGQWKADPVRIAQVAGRDAYNTANGTTTTVIVVAE